MLSLTFEPNFLALDSIGRLYVSGNNNAVSIFADDARGNDRPVAAISGPSAMLNFPDGLAFDSSGVLYVASLGTTTGGGSITAYARGATGDVAPIRTIRGPATTLQNPTGLTIDGDGRVYVADLAPPGDHGSYIKVFSPNANGNVAPIAFILGLDYTQGVAVR